MEKRIFKVSKISCEHCKKTIEGALEKLDGVESVSVDIGSKTVEVEFEGSTVTEDNISGVLGEIGYPQD